MSFFILMLWQLHQCFWQFANTVQVKWKWNFEWNSFVSVCPLNSKYNVMWCNKTVQIINRNLYFSCFYIFNELCGILQYIPICIVLWCMVIFWTVLWSVYSDAYRIVKTLYNTVPYYLIFYNTILYYTTLLTILHDYILHLYYILPYYTYNTVLY